MPWEIPSGPWNMIMKPSDMPPRRGPYENPDPQTALLLHLAEQAGFLMRHYLGVGMSEDTALVLTEITLDRYDQGDTL